MTSRLKVTWIVPQSYEVPSGIYLLENREIPDERWAEAHRLTTKYLEELQSLETRTNPE